MALNGNTFQTYDPIMVSHGIFTYGNFTLLHIWTNYTN